MQNHARRSGSTSPLMSFGFKFMRENFAEEPVLSRIAGYLLIFIY